MHAWILANGLDAVVAPLTHTMCATGSMSHGQRTHTVLAPKLLGKGRFANTLHLIGEDIQICWLGACLFMTYVPKRPSLSVSTPCCGATRCQFWTQARPQASD